jgi:hypothetical protein
MPELPTGTVTFLFTDIEGSTRLWEEQREAMRGALARHDDIVLAAVTRVRRVRREADRRRRARRVRHCAGCDPCRYGHATRAPTGGLGSGG